MKFKTSINCGGCVATVTPVLNKIEEISEWNVDTLNPEKILSIETSEPLDPAKVIEKLKEAGHKAELIAE
ncbi:hypothetical protein GVN16_01710 [Emticicia sp. CRIBPO]|uniref:heavy-metal-associated domain-containing protein n=1 Tax=Emticicia sp. CRIBPO TaxID=2683258 RepID=UPI0014130B03|nr:heavy-metal-associated domain-containing protein [Emticicia sp. CRIBPO]NBA84456.1 hypothetical protein [Emticicia sp. CRIBPO]